MVRTPGGSKGHGATLLTTSFCKKEERGREEWGKLGNLTFSKETKMAWFAFVSSESGENESD